MGLVRTLLAAERRAGDPQTVGELDALMDRLLGGAALYTGKTLTTTETLQVAVVKACVSLLAEMVATLPLPLYRRVPGGGRFRAFDHPLYALLNVAPNPEMTAFQWRETLMGHLLLWGNHYSFVEQDDRGVIGLWPLRPDRMEVKRQSGKLIYTYQVRTDGGSLETRILAQSDLLHVRALSTDGITGLAPIDLARQSIGLAQAQEEYGARFFGNGSRPDGVLTHPGRLSVEGAKRLKESWENLHRGLEKSHRVAVLEEGVSWAAIGIPPEQAQFLEARKFQRTEIAMIFRVPPHMISDTERSTSWGTGIEQQSIGFVTFTLAPWLSRIEHQITRDLLTEQERTYLFAEFLTAGLLRGDLKARYESYAIGRNWGWLSVNDIRRLENMNPLQQGGDVYLQPLNMVPAGTSTPPANGSSQTGQGEGARMWFLGFEAKPEVESVS